MLAKSFDQQLESLLNREPNATGGGSKLLARYNSTQQALMTEVFNEINAVEPHMTDHGYRHVRQVQENALRLLSDDGSVGRRGGITSIELYCLGMMILLHDAGMIHGRSNHHKQVAKLFNRFVPDAATRRHERSLIVAAARAYTGTAPDGSADTLKSVDQFDHLDGQPLRLRELAAVLRLADELAEGPDRTSRYLQESEFYPSPARAHHEYSSAVSVFIDRTYRRIVMKYDVEVRGSNNAENHELQLQTHLHHIYRRILKTDRERRYTREYSEFLRPFESTEVSFNFHCRGELLDCEDLSPVRLPELEVPNGLGSSDGPEAFWQSREAYDPTRLIPQLLSKCEEVPLP